MTRSNDVASAQCRSSRTRHTRCSSGELQDEVLHSLEHAAAVHVVRSAAGERWDPASRAPRPATRGCRSSGRHRSMPSGHGSAQQQRRTEGPRQRDRHHGPSRRSCRRSAARRRARRRVGTFRCRVRPRRAPRSGTPSRLLSTAAHSAASSSSRPTSRRLRTPAMPPSWRGAASASAGPATRASASATVPGHAVDRTGGKDPPPAGGGDRADGWRRRCGAHGQPIARSERRETPRRDGSARGCIRGRSALRCR